MSTLSVPNPGSTFCSRRKLLSSSPAATRRTSANAVSAITSTDRVRPVLRLADPRVLSSLSSDHAFPRKTTSAGARPKTRPVTTASPIVNASTAGWSVEVVMPGTCCDPRATRARAPATPRRSPPSAPRAESTRPSVSICRTSRCRPAPRVVRIASSRYRPVARISRRFATFAQAIRRTSRTNTCRK